MQYFLSVIFCGFIFASSWLLALPAAASPVISPVATLPGLGDAFRGASPDSLGVQAGHLAPCPPSPNCVVSQSADADHVIEPIAYQGDRATVRKTLLEVLSVVPRTTVVAETEDYIWFESQSRLMGFVDDGEFYLPADENVIHMRSAARLGESDLGVNRRRLEQIRLALQDLGVSAAKPSTNLR
ncbi:MAG: DUF1499 domain-containing protein [Leptolyngbyaceae cyanobacterium SM1_1_3]|nr:DUF1499 domain-containing protein [Leptolyngbyaceae cyanobacterium SM1_1_3]NJN03825.1 DUF1499 domain-containing protein [Leptolyngbyaceae cyanobacterium RM1_1_2]NJO08639.1 DUF1499 domain-containing protein [Leptolyngbyaceae cyanobacterium SL_1_1]